MNELPFIWWLLICWQSNDIACFSPRINVEILTMIILDTRGTFDGIKIPSLMNELPFIWWLHFCWHSNDIASVSLRPDIKIRTMIILDTRSTFDLAKVVKWAIKCILIRRFKSLLFSCQCCNFTL